MRRDEGFFGQALAYIEQTWFQEINPSPPPPSRCKADIEPAIVYVTYMNIPVLFQAEVS